MSRPHGIDVSQYQPASMDLTGYDFVMIRGSIGTTTDTSAAAHVAHATAAGIPWGVYHFATNDTPAVQAKVAVDHARALGALKRGRLGLVIDCEGTLSHEQGRKIVADALGLVAGTVRPQVGVYCSPGWIGSAGDLGASWGWLAQWNGGPPARPTRPPGWRTLKHRHFLRLWQYAVTGTPRLDRDLYMGSRRNFRRWVNR